MVDSAASDTDPPEWGSWDWDLVSDQLHLDAHIAALLGHDEDPLPLTLDMAQWLALMPANERTAFEQAWARHLSGQGAALSCEVRLTRRDGAFKALHMHGRIVARDADGLAVRLAGVLTDVDQLRAWQRQAALAESVIVAMQDGVVITDAHGRIVRVNHAFERITGYARHEVIGRNPSLLASGRHDAAFFSALKQALQTQGCWSGEIWNRRRDGSLMVNWMTISAIRHRRGDIQGYVGVFHDITQRKQGEAQLQRAALTDALTGLGNRVLLHDRLRYVMARSVRHGSTMVVAMLDLDGFKAINDTHGHAAGDRLLITLAQRLRALAREVDTVVRLGGDEFVLLLPDLSRAQDAEPIAQRILHAMAQPVDDAAGALQVSASIGLTFYPQDAQTNADTLLQQADQAMYDAKRSGRNRYAWWSPACASNAVASSAGSAGAKSQP